MALPGTVQIDDIESVLGRVGVRVGTNFVDHNIAWSPFATAAVYHEFAGDVTTQQTTDRPQCAPLVIALFPLAFLILRAH